MVKRPTLTDIGSGYTSNTTLNNNFDKIKEAFDNTLSLDGSSPNQMEADLDLNSNDILNAKDGEFTGSLTVAGVDINDLLDGVGPGTVFNTTNRFNGDGSTLVFTLTRSAGARANTMVFIDGVYQQKDTYTVSGTTLTFSTAPPVGTNNIEVNIQESTEGVSLDDLDAASVKTLYESNANTNAYTDAEKTKLSGIETGAEVNPTGSEIINTVGSLSFASRADAVTWVAANTPSDGFIVSWPDASVVADSTATMITDMSGFKPKGMWTPQHFGDITGSNDSTTIQAMWDATSGGQTVLFPSDTQYGINATVDAPMSNRYVIAQGASFVISVDSYAFDFNPDANSSNVETGSKSYGEWSGGTFTSSLVSPTATAAFRIYACRQMRVSDCVFGDADGSLVYGVMVSALGGHFFENNRFFYNTTGVYCPVFAVDGPGQPISTSVFINCNWTMRAAQNDKCVYNDCGANRWTFNGGFCNGTLAETFHFTNTGSEAVREIKWINFGFEQAVDGGKFVYFENTDGTHSSFSQVSFDSCEFGGNPSGVLGHIHVDCERVKRVSFNNCSANGNQLNNNWTLRCDSGCEQIVADAACRWFDNGLVDDTMFDLSNVDRREIFFPDKYMTPTFFTTINGTSYSSTGASPVTLDMPTLLSGQYPLHGLQPKGYTLQVQIRDSGSSALGDRRVKIYPSGLTDLARPTVTLEGIGDDSLVMQTIYVPCSDDGTVLMDVYASGTNTLDVWIRCVAIHN